MRKIRAVVMLLAGGCAVTATVVLLYRLGTSPAVSHTAHRMFHHRTKLSYPKSVADMLEEKHHMPLNPIYSSPDSMAIVGDRTDRYARLRQEVDAGLPEDPDRSRRRVEELAGHAYAPITAATDHSDQLHPSHTPQYDIHHCPEEPPPNYPFAWNMLELLQHWPPDDPTPRPHVYQSLCVFDYTKDYDKALKYRAAELPFVVVNDPQVHRTVERWNTPGYMETLLGEEPHRCEFS